jgi:hypothetical protein
MKTAIWNIVARIVSHPVVAAKLIARAKRTPFRHIYSEDGATMYMGRYWLFNPYKDSQGKDIKRSTFMERLPSIRLHHIKRADLDRHLHDHPWTSARTIIMSGGYVERKLVRQCTIEEIGESTSGWEQEESGERVLDFLRTAGNTSVLGLGLFHRITEVTSDGAWTLFITWREVEGWGFLLPGGVKILSSQYLSMTQAERDACHRAFCAMRAAEKKPQGKPAKATT